MHKHQNNILCVRPKKEEKEKRISVLSNIDMHTTLGDARMSEFNPRAVLSRGELFLG